MSVTVRAQPEAKMAPPSEPSSTDKGSMRSYAQYSGIAIQMIVTLLVAMKGGQWLDERFGTAPLYLTICLLVGLGLALWLPLRALVKK